MADLESNKISNQQTTKWKRPTIPPQTKTIPWKRTTIPNADTISDKYKRQRGRPRKATKKLQLNYKKSQDISQKHVTKTIKSYTESNYNLRSAQNANKTEFNTTKYDVRTNRQIAHNTITQAHLPFITQQPNLNNYKNSNQQMDNSNNEQTNPTAGSPSPRKDFSMGNYLSPTPKQLPSERNDQLPQPLEDIFNIQLIAAMTNRDTVLREVRDCILTGVNQRCKKLSKQIHAKWRSISGHTAA